MQHFDYKPHGVCPMNISFDLDGDTVHNVSFKGGCNGNRISFRSHFSPIIPHKDCPTPLHELKTNQVHQSS